MAQFNKMQQLKRRFFAMRNGAVAESLRRRGAPYRIIFGLNLPQLSEIAGEFGPDAELSCMLRDNVATRESMLIAPMLYPRHLLDVDTAYSWLVEAPTTEVVDVACLKLIKYIDNPEVLFARLVATATPHARYCALRLGANLLPRLMDETEQLARSEIKSSTPLTHSLATMLLDDIDFRRSDS